MLAPARQHIQHVTAMDSPKPASALFSVFLRLRPSTADTERFLDVEEPSEGAPTHITIKPPSKDSRRRAVERFAFTRVFEESAGQREIFDAGGVLPLVRGVLGAPGREGRDGLLATLGMTGSGKSHTILGSRTQRGLTQLALDLIFASAEPRLVDVDADAGAGDAAYRSLVHADRSEATLFRAQDFLDGGGGGGDGGNVSRLSRAATPALESSFLSAAGAKRYAPRLSALPTAPSIDDIALAVDHSAEYAVVVSMYEVYNDRIFDLLAAPAAGKPPAKQRRALLFKSTEGSPDAKVVAGLRKVICSTLDEALLVLETGLQERRVAGTGSNAVSSRSHGFFCIDVKKRARARHAGPWTSSTLTVVDLAGSERARQAKTAGATLAEAGKINESLMYLGQCMQMQSDNAHHANQALVPYRQCKLTELLFSNSFSPGGADHKPPQKAVMIVTADPLGDFNATSQILRYSALAREVTVPRIPSVTSTILAGTTHYDPKSGPAPGRQTPSGVAQDLEAALAEVTRLREALEITRVRLDEETHRRTEAEAAWAQSQLRIDAMEEDIRAEVCDELEARYALDARRWRAARDAEQDRQDEHVDRKIDLLARAMQHAEEDADDDDDEDDEDEDDEEAVHVSDQQQQQHHHHHHPPDQEPLPPPSSSTLDPTHPLAPRVGSLALKGPGRKVGAQQLHQQQQQPPPARVPELEDETARPQGLRSPSKKLRVLKTRPWDGDAHVLCDDARA